MEEEGLGGMAEAPALAASPDNGFGGTIGDDDLDDEIELIARQAALGYKK